MNEATGDVKVLYDSQRKYEQITGRLHMLREWKVGVSCLFSCLFCVLWRNASCSIDASFTHTLALRAPQHYSTACRYVLRIFLHRLLLCSLWLLKPFLRFLFVPFWQDGVPRGAYRGTVQLSWRKGRVRLFIAPAPGFKYEKPKGEVLLDSSGAVRKVRRAAEVSMTVFDIFRVLRFCLPRSAGNVFVCLPTSRNCWGFKLSVFHCADHPPMAAAAAAGNELRQRHNSYYEPYQMTIFDITYLLVIYSSSPRAAAAATAKKTSGGSWWSWRTSAPPPPHSHCGFDKSLICSGI